MQIGNPTDVKHVAHIGWDGPSDNATAPSWVLLCSNPIFLYKHNYIFNIFKFNVMF